MTVIIHLTADGLKFDLHKQLPKARLLPPNHCTLQWLGDKNYAYEDRINNMAKALFFVVIYR